MKMIRNKKNIQMKVFIFSIDYFGYEMILVNAGCSR
jgi:hypothetical protein